MTVFSGKDAPWVAHNPTKCIALQGFETTGTTAGLLATLQAGNQIKNAEAISYPPPSSLSLTRPELDLGTWGKWAKRTFCVSE